jgi:hypothetical protein
MSRVANLAHAREQLASQLGAIARLRGSGPNPFDYDLWQTRTRELIAAVYGEDSPEMERYEEALGIRGRLPGVRGQAENMTLNIHGQWGILGRLDRAEPVLSALIAAL